MTQKQKKILTFLSLLRKKKVKKKNKTRRALKKRPPQRKRLIPHPLKMRAEVPVAPTGEIWLLVMPVDHFIVIWGLIVVCHYRGSERGQGREKREGRRREREEWGDVSSHRNNRKEREVRSIFWYQKRWILQFCMFHSYIEKKKNYLTKVVHTVFHKNWVQSMVHPTVLLKLSLHFFVVLM